MTLGRECQFRMAYVFLITLGRLVVADFFTAIRYGFQGYFDFKSCSTRAEYWYWSLFAALGVLVLVLLKPLAITIPSLAVCVRRLRDTGRTGCWMLLKLISLIGDIILLVWFCHGGTEGSNRFGNA